MEQEHGKFRLFEKVKGLKNIFINHKIIAYPALFTLIILTTVLLSNIYIANDSIQSQVKGITTSKSSPVDYPIIYPSKKPGSIITPSAFPTATPTIKPAPKKATPTPDPDPIVNCTFKTIPSKQMRKSECDKAFECQVNGKWLAYTSREACTKDQGGSVKRQEPQNTASLPKYEPCISQGITYNYISPEMCASWKAEDEERAKESAQIQEKQKEGQINSFIENVGAQVKSHNDAVESCRAEVNRQYNAAVQRAGSYSGGAREAAIQIASQDKQRAYASCGETIS